MLAKATSTLDLISGGPMKLGLGAGGFWDAVQAMGGPRRGSGEAVAEEPPHVKRRLRGALFRRALPARRRSVGNWSPAHPIGVWVGAYGPRMLELTDRATRRWLDPIPPLGSVRAPTGDESLHRHRRGWP